MVSERVEAKKMRLIDTENFCKEHQDFPSVVYVALSKSPTIDPIHAAGGCRCAECKFASSDGGYEYPGQAETHVNCTIRLTRNHRAVIMPKDGHCSCGERKDGKTHDNQ